MAAIIAGGCTAARRSMAFIASRGGCRLSGRTETEALTTINHSWQIMAKMESKMPLAEPGVAPGDAQDAISVLTEDHERIRRMFMDFEKLTRRQENDDRKNGLVRRIWMETAIHAQVEDEIFYPALREAIDDHDLLDEAEIEHASFNEVFEQLESMGVGNEHYDVKVMVLGEYLSCHFKAEQDAMFRKIKKAGIDTLELGGRIVRRSNELQISRHPWR